jgi:hypothetical protein
MPDGLIQVIKSHGLHAGVNHLRGTIHNIDLTATIRTLYIDVGVKHAQLNYSRMRGEIKGQNIAGFIKINPALIAETKFYDSVIEIKQFGFNPQWTRFVLDFLQRFLIEKITFEVSTTTRDEMLKVLQQAINEGWSIDQTVKALEDLPFTQMQAARIVRTEVNRAANVGAKAQSETFQYEQMKEWISAEDSRVRGTDPKDHASHVNLDGQRINDGDVFVDPRNGDLLEFPGDPRASAESTINCRCSIAYTAKRDANGRLIPKRQTTTVIFPNQNRRRQTILV